MREQAKTESRPWLPVSWGAPLFLLLILIAPIELAVIRGRYEALWWWLLLPLFSPRILARLAPIVRALTKPFAL
jgi:hypothetical protein